MQIDRKKLDRILGMSDEQLSELVRAIANEAGVDPATLGLNPQNIQSIRTALGSATDQDLEQLNGVYEEYRKNRRNR